MALRLQVKEQEVRDGYKDLSKPPITLVPLTDTKPKFGYLELKIYKKSSNGKLEPVSTILDMFSNVVAIKAHKIAWMVAERMNTDYYSISITNQEFKICLV